MTIMDDNKTAEQRRTDLLERLRMRFYQYQKQHTDSSERYVGNEGVKEEKERQENHMFQQRILNNRAGSNKTTSKVRLDINSSRQVLNEAGLNNNIGGDQAMMLQTLKRRFSETVNNHSLSTVHPGSHPTTNDESSNTNPSKKPLVSHSLSLESEESPLHRVNNTDGGLKSTSATQLTTSSSSSVTDISSTTPSGNTYVSSATTGNQSTNIQSDSIGNSTSNDSNNHKSQSQVAVSQNNYETPAVVNNSNEQQVASNQLPASSSTNKNFMSHNSEDGGNTLKDEYRQIPSGELPEFSIEQDLADFEDVFRNISETEKNVSETNNLDDSKQHLPVKQSKMVREKPQPANPNLNGVHKNVSGSIQSGLSHLSHFEGNTFATSQPLMSSSHFSPAANTSQAINKMQQQQQQSGMSVTRPMLGGASSGYQNMPTSNPNPGFGGRGSSTRPGLTTPPNAKNPEIVEKLQQHLYQQLRRKQQQAVASPIGMPTALQHHQYRQSMMNYMQQAQKPRMPSMSPSVPPNYRQHPVASPVDQMQQNPFHFQPDYNMYLEQQKMMQSPDVIPMQSPTMNNPRMPPGYYPHNQDPNYGMVQSPMFQNPPQRTATPNMFAQSNAMRQHMMGPNPAMNMMSGQGYQQGMYQGNPGIPQRLPPQYSDASFHFNQMPMDNQAVAQSQSQMSSSRLSHFMTPDKDATSSMHGDQVLKSPNQMVPPYSVNAAAAMQQQQQHQQSQQRNKMFNGNVKPMELNDNLPKYAQTNDYRNMQVKTNQMMRFNGQMPTLPNENNVRTSMMGQYYTDQMVPQTTTLDTSLAHMQQPPVNSVANTKPKQEMFSPIQSIESNPLQDEPEDIETLLSNPPQDFDLVKMLGHDM